MQPTTSVFEPREDLGMRFEEFDLAMNRLGFIGHRVMPIIARSKVSGKFPRVPIDQLLVNLDTKRNPDGTYKRSQREFEDDNYETEEHGLEATLDDRTVHRYDDLIDAEVFEGEVIENALLTTYEKAIADLVFNNLMAEASDVLMQSHAGDRSVRIIPTGGGEEVTVDAILGSVRVEEDEVEVGDLLRVRKVERMDVRIRPTDKWNLQQEANVSIGDDTTDWSIETTDGHGSAFWILRLARPWIKKRQRSGYER